MFKAKRCLITAKNEASYGVDPVPTGAANAILARNVRFKNLAQELEARRPALPWFGGRGKVVARSWHEVTFECEIAGAGAAGDVPGYGPLLKACAMSETINAATNVIYAPITTGESSVTIYFYIDGKLHKMVGAMGTVSLNFEKGKVPLYQFRFLGLYVLPADTAIVTPTLTTFQTPLAVNLANTTPATVHAFAAKFSKLMLDIGNVVTHRNVPNSEAIRFLDRDVKGSVSWEAELVATKDWYTIARAATLGALAVTHGTVAGNKVTVGAPNLQIEELDGGDEEGVAYESVPFNCRPGAAGGDEFSITVL